MGYVCVRWAELGWVELACLNVDSGYHLFIVELGSNFCFRLYSFLDSRLLIVNVLFYLKRSQFHLKCIWKCNIKKIEIDKYNLIIEPLTGELGHTDIDMNQIGEGIMAVPWTSPLQKEWFSGRGQWRFQRKSRTPTMMGRTWDLISKRGWRERYGRGK